jgi:tetratricopeptide (TPR) repeat protein
MIKESWALPINDTVKIKNYLARLTAQQLDEQFPDLAGLLGLLIITGKISYQEMLPKDCIFIRHLSFAQEALSAYRNNRLEDIEPALKKLPFRSAFRDFRTVMKAALLMPESIEQAQALLAGIPADSPYHRAAALLLALMHSGSQLAIDLFRLSPPQIRLVEAVKNFNQKQIELLEALIKQKSHLSDKVKFDLALQYRELFGDHAKNYCLAALSTYPDGQRDFIRHFGPMDDFEAWRLKALSCERNGNFHDAEYYWQQGISVLKTRGVEGASRIALIMRHIAAHQEAPEERMSWLIDSLEHDPDDRETFIKILQYLEQHGQETDTYKEWLNKSIRQFPDDIELLGLAIKAAERDQAYTKAAQYARALLKVDPVNTFAKKVLLSSHLAHAGTLIKSRKFDLAEEEIRQAEQITIGKSSRTQAQLMRGFLAFVAEDEKRGAGLIADAVQKRVNGLVCAHFFAAMEALLLDCQIVPVLQALPQPETDYYLSEQEITQLIGLIHQYADDNSATPALLHEALVKVQAIINHSIRQQDYSEELLLSLCQCLGRIRHFELLDACLKTAQPSWIKPIWNYYRVYAEVKGDAGKCSEINFLRLQISLENARQEIDQRAVARIGKFLDQYHEAHNMIESSSADDIEAGCDNPLHRLFGHLPDDLYDQLEAKLIEISENNPQDRTLKMLAVDYLANDVARMESLCKDPDALFAFLLLKASDELGFNIDVNAADVIECFGKKADSKPASLFSFFKSISESL